MRTNAWWPQTGDSWTALAVFFGLSAADRPKSLLHQWGTHRIATVGARIALLMNLVAGAAFGEKVGEPATIVVRIYDYAEVSESTLASARREATHILQSAGLAVRWERCRTSNANVDSDPSCSKRAGEAVIQMRIHPSKMTRKLAGGALELGYAVASRRGYGVVAGVFFDRTRSLARQLGASLGVMLGHAMAHEIGHLLLGSNSHANRGIMRPLWDGRDLHLAHMSALGFTQSQAQRMQQRSRERMALQRAAEPPAGAERALAQLFDPVE